MTLHNIYILKKKYRNEQKEKHLKLDNPPNLPIRITRL